MKASRERGADAGAEDNPKAKGRVETSEGKEGDTERENQIPQEKKPPEVNPAARTENRTIHLGNRTTSTLFRGGKR
jgi:hypothetical protein